MTRITLSALFAAAVVAAAPHLALGHAFPEHADPRVGATVTAPPGAVRIWFNTTLAPGLSTIAVYDARDAVVDSKDGRVDPGDHTLLEVSVPPLPPGRYTVVWRVAAREGHATSGRYAFRVKEGGRGDGPGTSPR